MYQITPQCVCCHNCAMECPRQAIYYLGLKYEIDQDKCIECGLCAQICHTNSILEVGVETPVHPHPPLEKSCDVVVCGGSAGLVAAVRAAMLGKKVILLEKAKKLGGNSDYAGAFFPVYTKWHAEEGYADVREEAVEEFWSRTDHILDRDVLHTAVYGAGEFFDWLCELSPHKTRQAYKLVPFGSTRGAGPIYGPAMLSFLPNRVYENLLCRDPAIGPGKTGTFVKHQMLETIQRERLNIEILTEHAAAHLLTDASGNVVGVQANDPGGKTTIHAKAVILATGGMGKSDEKLQKYFHFFDCETPIHRFSVPTDTGDAIDMLQELGVEPDPERLFCSIFGPAHHPFSYCIFRILDHPSCLSVNLNGIRWQDETKGLHGGRFEIAKQPKEIAWGIFTQENIDRIIAEFRSDPRLAKEHWIYETYQQELEEEAALPKPPVLIADTLDELAQKLGIAPSALLATVRQYNEFCMAGEDTQFHKSPEHLRAIGEEGPYYAIYGQRFSEGAFGGLRVTPHCEVTREDGTIIPGLYGVGDATSAMHRSGKLAVISELSWALTSAFVAGKQAANYTTRLM